MGISFKVSKIGTRFRPKPSAVPEEPVLSGESSRVLLGAGSKREVDNAEVANDANGASVSSTCSGGLALSEHEVSFTLNLYQTGYIIGKPSEMENFQPHLQDAKSLHPYDRASETLFAAIESGWLPGDILDDIPSKYIDGTLVCEVRDYRKCIYEPGTAVSAVGRVPIVHKVQLRMSLENVVKDIPLISDDSWTYSDLMEVESRIVKALQPQLCLDTTPMLDRLCNAPTSSKLDLGIGRKRRLQQTPEVTVTSNYQTHGKKVCIDRLPENANGGLGERGTLLDNATIQQAHESMATQNVSRGFPSLRSNNFAQETGRPTLPLSSHHKLQPAVSYPTVVHDRSSGPPVSFAGVNTTIPSSQNLMGSFADNINGNAPPSVKRENQDAESTSLLSMKRPKQTPMRLDGVQQQQPGAQLVGLDGPDMHWKNQLLHSLDVVKGMQCSSVGGQRYPSPVMSNVPNQEAGAPFYFNQQGIRYGAKEEQADKAKMDKQELERTKDALQALVSERTVDCHQSQSQHLLQQQSMRNHLPALTQWHNARQIVEKDMRRDDILQKRKSVPSPHVSSGPMVQSPVSSKSGEISSGSVGVQFSAVATASALVSQKDKIAANSNAAVGAPSVTSSPSDSVHRQHQDSVAGKRRTNSIPKTQAMSGVGSPASVSNMSAPLNANSPSIGTAPMGDQILERFAKIKILTQKYHLNIKNNNVDDYPAMKPVSHANQQLASCFSDPFTADDFTDSTRPMSRSSLGGTINTCKTRKMCFMCTEHAYQVVPPRAQCQVTLTEKPYDGTVTMLYGDVDEFDLPNTQEFVVMLPTTHHADLLAAQFCAQMEREGYQKTEDRIHPTPMRMVAPSSSMATASGVTSDNASPEVKQSEIASGQTTHVTAQANTTVMGPLNSSQNLPNSARMLASGNNSQPLQSYLPGSAMPARTQQLDQTLLQQQQQQQQHQMQQQQQQHQMQQQQQLPLPHIQRSSPLLSANPLHLMGQNSNLQIGNSPMVNNKPAASQLQILQQQTQQQQQQQSQLTRKVMMGPIGMNMGNMGNNMVGLSGLSNPMGMGGVRGISSPMGPMSGLGNISPNQMNLGSASNFSVGLRPGSRSQAEAAAIATKLRMARAGLYGHQSGIAGMVGNNNQMLSNSAGLMLGHALNRANMNPLHRNAMSSMGPPKIPGTNFYLNAQQLQQLQHPQQLQQQQLQHPQQLQQQQLQQLQQLQQQQQQINSPLQQTQVGSPPVAGSPPAMIMQQQQISPPQMGQQPAMSPQQLSSAVLQKINCGNAVAGPASPQLSSQTHGSVGSITSSPMEQLQGANKGGSASNV